MKLVNDEHPHVLEESPVVGLGRDQNGFERLRGGQQSATVSVAAATATKMIRFGRRPLMSVCRLSDRNSSSLIGFPFWTLSSAITSSSPRSVRAVSIRV